MVYTCRRAARQREIAQLKSKSKNVSQNILAYIAIIAFFFMTGFVLSHGLGKMDKEASFIIGNLTGMAAAIAKGIYSYYFGSSKGESEARLKVRKKINRFTFYKPAPLLPVQIGIFAHKVSTENDHYKTLSPWQ